jgi:hypothetical protein
MYSTLSDLNREREKYFGWRTSRLYIPATSFIFEPLSFRNDQCVERPRACGVGYGWSLALPYRILLFVRGWFGHTFDATNNIYVTRFVTVSVSSKRYVFLLSVRVRADVV